MINKLPFLFAVFFVLACNSQASKDSGNLESISVFNEKNLDSWRGDQNVWSVENGCIVGRTTDKVKISQNTFLIYETEFSDFELTFNYKIIGGNSGVQYRAKVLDEESFVVGGYQADMEAGIEYSGILYEEKGRGILANRGEKVVISDSGEKTIEQFAKTEDIQSGINQNQWNHYRIVANGNHLQYFINGNKTIDVIDNEVGKKAMSGVIALQVHTGPNMEVLYKDIVIKLIEK